MSLAVTQPTAIKRITDDENDRRGIALSITWGDGGTSVIEANQLRRACPCATCKEKHGDTTHSKPLIGGNKKSSLLNIVSATDAESTNLERVWAIGNYALGMRWQDGHDSGIYSYTYLRELVENATDKST